VEIRRGIGVSPGVAICRAQLLEREGARPEKRLINREEIHGEIERFRSAVDNALAELEALRNKTAESLGERYGAILDFHSAMLTDPSFREEVERRIQLNKFSAEYAVQRVLRNRARSIASSGHELFRQRASDIADIEHRLLRHLGARGETTTLLPLEPVILVARDLTPSQTASLSRKRVHGFATDLGGKTSHTAIVARALGIPAVVGLGSITREVSAGDLLVIDGSSGTVVIDPDQRSLERYRLIQRAFEEFEAQLEYLVRMPAETVDGFRVSLHANIEFREEVKAALDMGADGIGLYRTEFLYLESERPPDEERQYHIYREAAKLMAGKPVVIRTLDLGADKMPQGETSPEANPFLGCRSIRYTLICRPDLLKTQLRAILRASTYGDVRIMLPMVTSVEEIVRTKALLADAMDDLRGRGIAFNPQIQLGVMIEVPSAALAADTLAAESDFFSIGTNDLIQYVLAVDRGNSTVASLYQPGHPAVLRLLRHIIETGRKHSVPVAMCGEMSGDVVYVPLLLGLGLEQLSAAPPNLLEVRRVIRSLTLREAEETARKVLTCNSAGEAEAILREKAHSIVPQLV